MKKPGKQDTLSTADKLAQFITVWKVDAYSREIGFTTMGSYTIDWGDGCVEQIKSKVVRKKSTMYNEVNHVYAAAGEYNVKISPEITKFCTGWETKQLIEIKQWGAAQWQTTAAMFSFAINMICTATDSPDLSKVENMGSMFYGCSKFNSPIEHWDVSRVKDISNALGNAKLFNQPLALWDLRSAENVSYLLNNTPAFDQDLRDLKVSATRAKANEMFGLNESLAQYNEMYNEMYNSKDEKQKVLQALGETHGDGLCAPPVL